MTTMNLNQLNLSAAQAIEMAETQGILQALVVHQMHQLAQLQALVNQTLEASDIWVDMWSDEGEPAPEVLALFADRMALLRTDCRAVLG